MYLLRAVTLNEPTADTVGSVHLIKEVSPDLNHLIKLADKITARNDQNAYSKHTESYPRLIKIGHGIVHKTNASWLYLTDRECNQDSYKCLASVEIYNLNPEYHCPFEQENCDNVIYSTRDIYDTLLHSTYENMKEFIYR